MANVLIVAERRGRIKEADAQRAVELILDLPILVEAENRNALRQLRVVSRTHNLSAYDACYLELAQRLGLPLATLDRTLSTVARNTGVPLLL
jgi:predicted nucleic acid-binding protein